MCEGRSELILFSNFSLVCTVLLLSLHTQNGDRCPSSRTEELRGTAVSEEVPSSVTSSLGLIDILQTFRVQQKSIMAVIGLFY